MTRNLSKRLLKRLRDDAEQIAAGNAGWRFQFRFAVHIIWSRVPELWTLDGIRRFMKLILAALVIGVLTWFVFYLFERRLVASERAVVLVPIALTILMIIWTAIVSPFSKYGDNWAIVPALALAPVVITWHLALFGVRRGDWAYHRGVLVIYALIHLFIFIPIWFGCLMLISKDGP